MFIVQNRPYKRQFHPVILHDTFQALFALPENLDFRLLFSLPGTRCQPIRAAHHCGSFPSFRSGQRIKKPSIQTRSWSISASGKAPSL
jgi:hypothetical protein